MKKIEVVLKNGMNVWVVDIPDYVSFVVGDDGFLRIPSLESTVYLNASDVIMITEKKQREKP